MKNISGIYKIVSIIKPDRIYIGSASDIHKRWIQHLRSLKGEYHHSKKLQRHYDKYGKNDLIFSILFGCEISELLSSEQYLIDSSRPYFNVCKIAGSTLGRKASEQTKKKMSLSRKGSKNPMYGTSWNKNQLEGNRKPISEETRKRISAGQYRRFERTEERDKISNSNKGRTAWNKGIPQSDEAKKKNAEKHRGNIAWNKGTKATEEHIRKL